MDNPEGEERWHGTAGGYSNHKCRCKRCRKAWAEKVRVQKKKRAAKEMPPELHGTENGYGNWGCRCYRCTSVWSQAALERRHRREERERLGIQGFSNWK